MQGWGPEGAALCLRGLAFVNEPGQVAVSLDDQWHVEAALALQVVLDGTLGGHGVKLLAESGLNFLACKEILTTPAQSFDALLLLDNGLATRQIDSPSHCNSPRS